MAAKINVDDLTLEEMNDIEAQISERRATKHKETVRDTIGDIIQMVSQRGLAMDDILPGLSGKRAPATKAAAKYQNPEDASQTWTGRGRKPKWVIEAIENGVDMEELLIA